VRTTVAALRLYCFPYAGGSPWAFRSWAPRMPPGVEMRPVQLPGHGSRLLEPRHSRIEPLVEALLTDVDFEAPLALFGHSMGALVAYEIARRLPGEPDCLYVSAHRAPQLPNRDVAIHALPEERFIQELRRLNGTPEAVLSHRELRELTLPVLRDDFALAHAYSHTPEPILRCRVVAFGGRDDPAVREHEVAAWRAVTTGPFRMHMVPGDHLSIDSVLGALTRDLSEAAP
jgi:medium-chain acyl-[acyl-carrier-protein] hydrolase